MTEYYTEDQYNMWWAPETTFGDTTTNDAGDTFYHLGVLLPNGSTPTPRLSRERLLGHTCGRVDEAFNYLMAKAGTVNVTGSLLNLDLLYFACKGCTTTGGPTYTHAYATSTARPAAVPSFKLYIQHRHGTETYRKLLVGCTIKDWSLTCDLNGVWKVTYTIQFVNEGEATELTAEPVRPQVAVLSWHHTTITWTRGGTAVPITPTAVGLHWDDGLAQFTGASSYTPTEVHWGPRLVRATIEGLPTADSDVGYARDDAATSTLNIDLTVKIARDSSTDYLQYKLDNGVWRKFPPTTWHRGYYITRAHELGISPWETGSKVTVTQVDANTAARFEGVP